MSGWIINATLEQIHFNTAPPAGVNNIVVQEFASGGGGGSTDVWAFGAFSAMAGWPSEVEYFSDRLFFAATLSEPQLVVASRIGDYHNHSRSVPVADDDAFQFRINARRLNQIRDLVALDHLIPLTSGGEFTMTAGADEVVTPSTVGFKPNTSWGASHLPAVVIGGSAIFVQEKGQIVRDIRYNFTAGEAGGYEGGDLSQWSAHLFRGYQLVDVSFAQSPHAIVYYVRDDGKMLALAYDREQQVVGWTPLDTRGQYKSVASIPEGDHVATYTVVRRIINGVEKRFIERFHDRQFTEVEDAFFVDCGLTFDGRNTTETTLTATSAGGWTENDELTITASADAFNGPSAVGDQLFLYYETEEYDEFNEPVILREKVRITISTFVSTTVVRGFPISTVPESLRGTATAVWSFARDGVLGLDHLEGESVMVLADGSVQGPFTVTGGAIALSPPAAVVHVGLPFTAELESLDVNFPGTETIRDREKVIRKVTLQCEKTRGLKAGPNRNLLNEAKEREFEDYDEPTHLINGAVDVDTESEWDKNGRFVVVQDQPLPCSILALIPNVSVGGRA
jgi:hypothetical protein